MALFFRKSASADSSQSSLSASDDEPLVTAIQGGGHAARAALQVLYSREAPTIYRYALALGATEAQASDAVQEAFVAFASNPRAFDPVKQRSAGGLGAYLTGIARYSLWAKLREAKRTTSINDRAEVPSGYDAEFGDDEDDGFSNPMQALGDDPELRYSSSARAQALQAALRRLPFAFREAVVLVELQELSYAQAAAIAGIEVNTLRTRLFRAKQRLRALLSDTLEREDGGASHRPP